jgi:ankyrin repeat protein
LSGTFISKNSAGANGCEATIGASLVARASAGPSLTSMIGLSQSRSTQMLALFLDKGAVISARDDDGRTAPHSAAERGIPEMISLLIGKGADIASVDGHGPTPLHCAAQLGYPAATKRLVDGGAVVSAVDNTGRTARDCAEERGLKRVIEVLDGGELSAFYIKVN